MPLAQAPKDPPPTEHGTPARCHAERAS